MIDFNSCQRIEALKYLESVNYQLLDEVKTLINEYSGLNLSTQYVRILAGGWILNFSHNLFVAFSNFKTHNSKSQFFDDSRRQVLRLHASCTDFQSREISSYISHLQNIILYCNRKSFNLLTFPEYLTYQEKPHYLTNLLSLFEESFLPKKPKVQIVGTSLSFSKKIRLRVSRRSFSVKVFARRQNLKCRWYINHSWRLNYCVSNISDFDDFVSCFRVLLPLFLPASLVEGLLDVISSTKFDSNTVPEFVFSNSGLYSSLQDRIHIAFCISRGSKLLYMQHGGGYNIEPYLAIQYLEQSAAHRYYNTLDSYDNESISLLPFPWECLPKVPIKQKTDILFVSVDYPNYLYKINLCSCGIYRSQLYNDTLAFLLDLPQAIPLTIRPHPVNYSPLFTKEILKSRIYSSVDTSKTFLSQLARSKLAVYNYLGTTFCESLYHNVPSICFADIHVSVLFKNKYKDLINQMLSVGILHKDPLSASNFIQSIINDIPSWWFSADLQNIRSEFVSLFAYSHPNWPSLWIEEFDNL